MFRPTVIQTGIRDDVAFGQGVVVYEPSNLYGCIIENNVRIGPFVEIQAGVRIGAGTKVQSHCFICEGVRIGERCFISHGAMFVNDDFRRGAPAGGDRSVWRETVLGDDVSVGTGAVILPVHICANVVVGAGAVVTKSIDRPGIYAGNPARMLRAIAV